MSKEYFRKEAIQAIKLPEVSTGKRVALAARHLPSGCYRLRWEGICCLVFEGSLRVDRSGTDSPFVSGDLYDIDPKAQHDHVDTVVPVYARSRYRYYLQLSEEQPSSSADHLALLDFELVERTQVSDRPVESRWAIHRACRFQLSGSVEDGFVGAVCDPNGIEVAALYLNWVSPWLRAATIEIDCQTDVPAPNASGGAHDWTAVGAAIGWHVFARVDDQAIPPRDQQLPWTNAECHDAMSKWRDEDAKLDLEWCYHLLCVDRLKSQLRGVMYDVNASDSSSVVREGAAVAANWEFPADVLWGGLQRRLFCSVSDAYFRTAVHEIGHAMSLFHDHYGATLMRPTEMIAEDGIKVSPPFPNNIDWSFSAADAMFLRHAPDPLVRPGGDKPVYHLESGDMQNVVPSSELQLTVTPVLGNIPLGAPVRLQLQLKHWGNVGGTVRVPADISMAGSHLRGYVRGPSPSDRQRDFRPLVIAADGGELKDLPKGAVIDASLTLLRGGNGALFPEPGEYEIQVALRWSDGNTPMNVVGRASVVVEPAANETDRIAAAEVLNEPDALIALAIGGNHLAQGINAIQAAMRSRTLRPHYAWIEAKRIAELPATAPSSLYAAAALIDVRTVLSSWERDRVKQMFEKNLTRLQWWRLQRCLRRRQPTVGLRAAMNIAFDALLRFVISFAHRIR